MSIPVLKPSITEEEIQAVSEVLRSGWLGLGPKTTEFEQALTKETNSRFAVGLNSGTAALHLAMLALGIGSGDEVIVSPMTFVSSVHAIAYCGATPVFADIESDTLNLDPKDAAAKITPHTRAIMPVHMAGHPCDMDPISDLASKHGLHVVEDAAHACGAFYRGVPIGSISEMTCFSFHAVKNVTCGEGGAITTNNEWYDRFCREMRWVGISRDTWTRTGKGEVYAWQYWVDKIGFKYHMSDINAAIGIVQLKRLSNTNARRTELAGRYLKHLSGLDWLELPQIKPYAASSWHLFQIKTPDEAIRNRLIEHLKNRDISPGVHYLPVHLQPVYRHLRAEVPIATAIWKRLLSLPMYPDMTDEENAQVIEAIQNFRP